ncbi:sorting nexin-13-like [Uloborus diversus]|uniref:sorting nexin-13-like n=1 Tax=Uloborus diversus TaxID=327109 RepID=UPI002408F47A|nr:sorting nexin-13-like [Uloborus diversus]
MFILNFWLWLIVALCLATFGSMKCIAILISFLVLIVSFFIVCHVQSKMTIVYKLNSKRKVKYPSCLLQINPTKYEPKQLKRDQRLTGSSMIDDPLQEVLNFAFRDYINTWYSHLSTDEEFLLCLKELVRKVIVAFSNRFKEVDWVPYLTTKLVDDFASHLRLFRQAQSKLKDSQRKDPTANVSLLSLFFTFETAMEDNLSRNLVSTSQKHELEYLQELCEVIMYIVLPPEDFQNLVSRLILREIIVSAAVLPIINLVSDPDYINQIIIWLCKDTVLTTDGFLLVIRCTDNIGELQAVLEMVNHEIAIQRSKDTGGDDDTDIKQQLSSLFYVQKVVETQMRRLREGTVDTDSTGMPSGIDWKVLNEPDVKLISLHFDVVLTNNIALHYFTDFMSALSAQGFVFFYHSVESYKVSAEQMLSQVKLAQLTKQSTTPADFECLREAAVRIFDLYLSDKATLRVRLDEPLLKKLANRIHTEQPSPSWFDESQMKVYEIMQEEQFFPAFKKSQNYIKLLAELDLLKEGNAKPEDDSLYCSPKSGNKGSSDDISLSDSISLSSLDPDDYGIDYTVPEATSPGVISPTAIPEDVNLEECDISAHIFNMGINNDSGSPFAVYAIIVNRRDPNGVEDQWTVVRRYSDFRDFHFNVVQKFPHLNNMQFPGKKTFNNLNPNFLAKRTNQLSGYLQCLINPEMLQSNVGLKTLLLQFLEPKAYEKGKKPLAKKVDALVNPLCSSMKSVGHIVKSVPDSFMDGLKDGIVKILGNRSASPTEETSSETCKVAAGLDVEGEDNIPLRILLLLMDEVFDLKSKDQWFRKRIVILLRQIINATYGDAINRRIIHFVQKSTSAEQMSEYIKAFRQAMWPNGLLAIPNPDRDYKTKMRSRVVAKLLLLCSIPDELKHVIGSETTRKGILCVFELFQKSELNRRFFYVLLEGILEILFPGNNLSVIIRRLHSRSSYSFFDQKEQLQVSPVIERKNPLNR